MSSVGLEEGEEERGRDGGRVGEMGRIRYGSRTHGKAREGGKGEEGGV